MFYLLHGDDEFTNREHLKKLRLQGDFEYNQDTFNGGEVDLGTITATCNTLPFLAEQRLVVVEGLPKKRRGESPASTSKDDGAARQVSSETSTGGKGQKTKKGKKSGKGSTETRAGFEKGLAEYISRLPDSVALIVLVDETLEASNLLVKAASEHGKVIQSMLPRGAALVSWIKRRAQSIGVSINEEAATLLANYIGNQLRLLANELAKLATYVGDGGTITVDDTRMTCF